jgi:hypothetical protein
VQDKKKLQYIDESKFIQFRDTMSPWVSPKQPAPSPQNVDSLEADELIQRQKLIQEEKDKEYRRKYPETPAWMMP